MKYSLITFGCQMNKSDSERIAALLENLGYKKTSKIDEADLIVVNMCSVRQSAVDRVYGLQPIFKTLKTKNYKLQTILTGCILKEDRKKFAQYLDYILDIKKLTKWPNFLPNQTIVIRQPWQSYYDKDYFKIQPKYSSFPIAYVPVSTGCNNFCSYCVVPYTRGPEIYRPVEEIISEVRNLVKKGYKEIWLLGQNVNSYKCKIQNAKCKMVTAFSGIPSECGTIQNSKLINFPKLLRLINNIPGNFWIRFTSSHPKDFSDELIEAMAEGEKVTPYLNLPVQSGDNEILKKMNRNYTIKHYKNLIKKIRKKIPDITLSTDIIVGFPGETKKQFENTVQLFKEIKFDMAYIAQYSPRPGTAAFKMKDDVPREEKKKREKILTEVLKKTALVKNKKYIGKMVEVLPTEYKNGYLIGKSFHYKTVKFLPRSEPKAPRWGEGSKDLIGKFVKVKITEAQPWRVKGEVKKEECP